MNRPHKPNRQRRGGGGGTSHPDPLTSQPTSQPRGRGQGRGRGRPSPRGRGNHQHHQIPGPYTPVPPISALHPGTPVAIILKQDQPTGHQVKGIVSELLTRGDHPRGVKVRLRDGRVGRVQKVVSESEGAAGEALVGGAEAGLGRDGDVRGRGDGGVRRGAGMERDVREHDEYFYDEERAGQRDLGYFRELEEADAREGGWSARERDMVPEGGGEVVTCPVCGNFEGDARAVEYHVEEHFAEG
ncbi:hypothetical protein BS50DRAFT_666022 [Corynespora cassiicola Philippines]|uniref:Uncharacterized protein n=1 Tax=Corynespora cassiicola Philippines TaxID=1448308 RepID=A0A2T2NSJ4_CORCC|nr:hypothetical protein BS50DRAFT_666022 [Corynespora cassiicola Philippines]